MEKTAETTWYVLEQRQPFAQSLLWHLQRHYFDARGVEAWRQGEVPHYITCNPTVATSYAEIVFGLFCDRSHRAAAEPLNDEPLYICELGAGSGRFAFHFLDRLTRLCVEAGVPSQSFRYVLTDPVDGNLQFWKDHRRFQPFIDGGLLDVALFDISESTEIAMHLSGRTITAGGLERPLVVIANYVFDTIPQDLFYVDEGECLQCLVSLAVDRDPGTMDAAELLQHVQCHYDRQPLDAPAYEEPWLQQILAGYQNSLTDTHLLFPAMGLRCLQRLKTLSKQGLLLLSADKGDHRLTALTGKAAPDLVRHGSFSLNVNYHAIKMYCERGGGLAMFPRAQHRSLNVSACLMVEDAVDHLETRRAFQRHVQDFSPDDFYTITRHACRTIGEMSVADILAYLRLSHYDSHLFSLSLPRLCTLADGLDRDEHRALSDTIDRVWDLYFPLGENLNLANGIALLLFEMGAYRQALKFLARSVEMYGQDTGTLANMALCHLFLGQEQEAKALLQTMLANDPANARAQELKSLVDSGSREEGAD